MNIIKRNNKVFKYESYWRDNKKDKKRDSEGKLFPYPEEGKKWTDIYQFTNKLCNVQQLLKNMNKFTEKTPKNCLLCDEKNITTGDFQLNNVIWENGLVHYIKVHNIKPSPEFIELIYNFNYNKKNARAVKMNGSIYKMDDLKYIKLDRNQILIMDALLRHGGYAKKYIDPKNKKIYRYSEHAGLIDFIDNGVDKIIISARTTRVDKGDEEIYLPSNIPDAFDYEYIFHTHPPTPKPGGRVDMGILYEFPSISDIFHFIDHYNDGLTQGSLVITPEGLYNIRSLKLNKKKININEDEMYKQLLKRMNNVQEEAIKKYGKKFNTYTFYSQIAQNTTYIDKINEILNNYGLHIDFFPRVKDNKGKWIIDTIYLPVYTTEKIY